MAAATRTPDQDRPDGPARPRQAAAHTWCGRKKEYLTGLVRNSPHIRFTSVWPLIKCAYESIERSIRPGRTMRALS